ncbi:MAG: hypothetical protein Q4D90_09305 [bacterium]|nr:hypothetical protein [bacterium]
MSQADDALTNLDALTATKHLKMMKAALPYMGAAQQRAFCVLIKAQELTNTLQLAREREENQVGICSLETQASSTLDMLTAIKPYGTQYEQDFIDVIMNFMQGFHLYNRYQESVQAEAVSSSPQGASSYIDALKKLLPKEQMGKLETFELLLTLIQQLAI